MTLQLRSTGSPLEHALAHRLIETLEQSRLTFRPLPVNTEQQLSHSHPVPLLPLLSSFEQSDIQLMMDLMNTKFVLIIKLMVLLAVPNRTNGLSIGASWQWSDGVVLVRIKVCIRVLLEWYDGALLAELSAGKINDAVLATEGEHDENAIDGRYLRITTASVAACLEMLALEVEVDLLKIFGDALCMSVCSLSEFFSCG